MTIAEVIERYLAHALAVGLHCPEARQERERVLGEFARHVGALRVEEAKAFHLSDWVESHPAWRSISTKRQKCNAVRACFNWAVEQERIDKNPFRNVRYGEAERRPDLPDDVLECVCKLANKRFEIAVRFLRLTGCRLGELCRARWSEFDLERGLWIIERHKSRRYSQRPKAVALVPEAVALLRSLPAGDPVFRNTRGTAWTRRTLAQALVRLKRKNGIETKASLHGVRHRAASAAIAAGAPLKLVSEQLGHASQAVTERFYWHRTDEHLSAIRDAFGKGIR